MVSKLLRARLENQLQCIVSPSLAPSTSLNRRTVVTDHAILTGDVIVEIDSAHVTPADQFSFYNHAVITQIEGGRSIMRCLYTLYSRKKFNSESKNCSIFEVLAVFYVYIILTVFFCSGGFYVEFYGFNLGVAKQTKMFVYKNTDSFDAKLSSYGVSQSNVATNHDEVVLMTS